jgi:hypothetical protein
MIPLAPVIFIVIGLVFVVIMMASSPQGPKPPPTVDDYIDGAKYACKAELQRRLHDPDSAEFPPWTEYHVSNDEATHAFVVRLRLRAKNGFGALRLIEAQCLITNMNLRPSGGGMTWSGTATVDS